jgi:cytochrome c peroxidase
MKVLLCACAAFAAGAVSADQPTSYMPVDIKEDFAATMKRMQAAKPAIEQRQQQLLEERYDLSNHPASGVSMSRGKPIQAGVRVKLPKGATWDRRDRTTYGAIR